MIRPAAAGGLLLILVAQGIGATTSTAVQVPSPSALQSGAGASTTADDGFRLPAQPSEILQLWLYVAPVGMGAPPCSSKASEATHAGEQPVTFSHRRSLRQAGTFNDPIFANFPGEPHPSIPSSAFSVLQGVESSSRASAYSIQGAVFRCLQLKLSSCNDRDLQLREGLAGLANLPGFSFLQQQPPPPPPSPLPSSAKSAPPPSKAPAPVFTLSPQQQKTAVQGVQDAIKSVRIFKTRLCPFPSLKLFIGVNASMYAGTSSAGIFCDLTSHGSRGVSS